MSLTGRRAALLVEDTETNVQSFVDLFMFSEHFIDMKYSLSMSGIKMKELIVL